MILLTSGIICVSETREYFLINEISLFPRARAKVSSESFRQNVNVKKLFNFEKTPQVESSGNKCEHNARGAVLRNLAHGTGIFSVNTHTHTHIVVRRIEYLITEFCYGRVMISFPLLPSFFFSYLVRRLSAFLPSTPKKFQSYSERKCLR